MTSASAIRVHTPRIAVDAMGGDRGPSVTVPAALAIPPETAEIILVGNASAVRPFLPDAAALKIHHASEIVSADEPLSTALRRKPDSSMRRALELHANGYADAVVSAGQTGALMALARLVLRSQDGIERPAIAKVLDGKSGPFWLLDLGANIDCSVRQLTDFAFLGDACARRISGIQRPRVGLLNIGTEAGKGPAVLGECAVALNEIETLNFTGFVEAHQLFDNAADVVVTDGFAGNVALKAIEGAAGMARHLVERAFDRNWFLRMVASTARLRQRLNPQSYNGASFVGLRGVVVKSHGAADAGGFAAAIRQAAIEIEACVAANMATSA